MKFELDLFEPVGEVLAGERADVDGPLVGVVGICVGRSVSRVDWFGVGTVDCCRGISWRGR